VKLTGKISNRR